MSTKVTIEFITDDDVNELQRFLHDVPKTGALSSAPDELAYAIEIRDFKYRTDPL